MDECFEEELVEIEEKAKENLQKQQCRFRFAKLKDG